MIITNHADIRSGQMMHSGLIIRTLEIFIRAVLSATRLNST